jgi:hypothetical protein
VGVADRVDKNGAAFAGSRLQTQLYVNRRTAELEDAVRSTFPELAGASFDWRSPLAEDGYAEYWDKAFLERVDLGHHAADLATFWPTGGPPWDGLAVISRGGDTRSGVLMLEGKSYPDELCGGGTGVKAGLAHIDRAVTRLDAASTGRERRARRNVVRSALPERQPPRAPLLAEIARRPGVARAPAVRQRPALPDERGRMGAAA